MVKGTGPAATQSWVLIPELPLSGLTYLSLSFLICSVDLITVPGRDVVKVNVKVNDEVKCTQQRLDGHMTDHY